MAVDPVITTAIKPDNDTEGKYLRILKLCDELAIEFEQLEKEGRDLRKEVQKYIDQHKIKEVLEKIVNYRDQ